MAENPFGFGGMFDPEDLNNAMRQFAEQAQESQSVAFADNAINLAVQMTTAAIAQITPTGTPEEQAAQLRADEHGARMRAVAVHQRLRVCGAV